MYYKLKKNCCISTYIQVLAICEVSFLGDTVVSNIFEIEWSPKSGVVKSFTEIDRAEWFIVEEELQKINEAMEVLILQLVGKLEY